MASQVSIASTAQMLRVSMGHSPAKACFLSCLHRGHLGPLPCVSTGQKDRSLLLTSSLHQAQQKGSKRPPELTALSWANA